VEGGLPLLSDNLAARIERVHAVDEGVLRGAGCSSKRIVRFEGFFVVPIG